MRIEDNPALERLVLNHLAEQYGIYETREPNHLSTFVYCLTRAFFTVKMPTEPTDEEVMLFALGYGLQDVLTPRDFTTPKYEFEGIVYRPDMVLRVGEAENLFEMKTTRKSMKKGDIPETWMAYMQGGCYIRKTNRYDLIILYMMGNYAPPFPKIVAKTFYFEDAELNANWENIKHRQYILNHAIANNTPPEPFQFNYAWECQYCKNKLLCTTITNQSGIEKISEESEQ